MKARSFVLCECKYIEFFYSAKTKFIFFARCLFILQKILYIVDALAIVSIINPGRCSGTNLFNHSLIHAFTHSRISSLFLLLFP